MTMRKMSNSFKGFNFYQSSFDPVTGILVRSVEVPKGDPHYHWDRGKLVESVAKHLGVEKGGYHDDSREPFDKLEMAWGRKYGSVHKYITTLNGKKVQRHSVHCSKARSELAFSPVPETIDVKITSWCNHDCSYCYMDSTTKGTHAPRELLTAIFDGLKTAPYQIAFGGGEPTAHPDFPWFLEYTKSKGTVPNYTTAGHILRDEVFEATNRFCGGVALTYHAFKGPEYFKQVYDTWRSKLNARVQLNVHVLFDKDVADNLLDLQEIGLKDLNVVLLAYYPSTGRSTWEPVAPKGVYEGSFPKALRAVQKSGFKIAFSEGLLAYFLSHRFPEVDMRFAGQQEGLFSCYVDDKGRVTHSSFEPAEDEVDNRSTTIYETKFQKIWEQMNFHVRHFSACDECKQSSKCFVPNESHYMLCKYASHNKTPPKSIPARRRHLTVL